MAEAMTKIAIESGEVRPFEGGTGQLHVVNTPTGPVGRAVFNPGWR